MANKNLIRRMRQLLILVLVLAMTMSFATVATMAGVDDGFTIHHAKNVIDELGLKNKDEVTFQVEGGDPITLTVSGNKLIGVVGHYYDYEDNTNATLTTADGTVINITIVRQAAGGDVAGEGHDQYQIASWEPIQKTGSLKVSKTIAGENPDTNKEFTFTVSLTKADGSALTGTFGNVVFGDNGKATLTLKHGESKTISDLPAGTRYAVEETADDDYTSTSVNAAGTIEADKTAVAAFTNTKKTSDPIDPEVKIGSLKVSKTVAGEKPDTDKEFSFTVSLTNADGSALTGTFGGVMFGADGKATFTLKHGGSKTIYGLPAGIKYTVEETADADYISTSVNEAGTIETGKTAEAAFTNTKKVTSDGSGGNGGTVTPLPPDQNLDNPDTPSDKPLPDDKHTETEVPKTGDVGADALMLNLLLLSISALAGTAFYLRRKASGR